ncbi:MAG TPA: hypothetical protein PKA64_15120 [Myxococcota bacterium]|nr:hypothetical protein [Myxococcota bacterium]
MSRIGVLALIAASVFLFAPRADALQMDLTRAELCRVSTAVVLGRVSDAETLWAANSNGGIERRVFVDTYKTLRGERAPMYEVVLPGGTMGELHHWVEDVPDLEVGAQYMLFLVRRPIEAGGGWDVIGGDGGAVQIAPHGFGKGETVTEAIASLEGCHG